MSTEKHLKNTIQVKIPISLLAVLAQKKKKPCECNNFRALFISNYDNFKVTLPLDVDG